MFYFDLCTFVGIFASPNLICPMFGGITVVLFEPFWQNYGSHILTCAMGDFFFSIVNLHKFHHALFTRGPFKRF